VAESFTVPSVKETMLTLAQSYDCRADNLESQLLKQSAPKPREC